MIISQQTSNQLSFVLVGESVSLFESQQKMASLSSPSLCFVPPSSKQPMGGRSAVVRLHGWITSLRTPPYPSLITCAAKRETVEKVSEIVRKQLALPPEKEVNGDSKFSDLGADSLDTVEIVMGLEEEFDISVEEDSSQNISTVQDAAELIDQLLERRTPPA